MTEGGPPRARLFVEDDLAAGATVETGRQQAHYLRNVLRLGTDAPVAALNGRDGEWRARVAALHKDRAILAVDTRLRAQAAEPDLWLLFAPVKRAPLDFLIEKAVELGVSVLQPVVTAHTDVARFNAERHRANVIEAVEQCERLTVPALRPLRPLGEVLADFPAARRLAVCAERGAARPVTDVFDSDGDFPRAILCGPEGGFAEAELDAFDKLPFITFVSLGPRILRAETAALAALSCWQAALGDWHRRPPEPGNRMAPAAPETQGVRTSHGRTLPVRR